MERIEGDDWLTRYAAWIRANEAKLGGSTIHSSSAASLLASSASSWLNPANWLAPPSAASPPPQPQPPPRPTSQTKPQPKPQPQPQPRPPPPLPPSVQPTPLRLNTHHLYYILIRAEALGIPTGPLDVKAAAIQPVARPPPTAPSSSSASTSLPALLPRQVDDTMSVTSRLSDLSSALSLGGARGGGAGVTAGARSSWWGGSSQPRPEDVVRDVKFIYSSLTKIPSLRLGPPPARLIKSFEDCPGELAVPLDCFKTLRALVVEDLDPRCVLGWDRMAVQLRSLTLRRAKGVEDVTELLVDCVLDDERRRRGEAVAAHSRHILHRPEEPGERDEASSSAGSAAAQTPGHGAEGDAGGQALPAHESTAPAAAASPSDPNGNAAAAAAVAPPTRTTDSPPPPELPRLAWHFLRHLCLSDNGLTFVPSTPLYPLADSLVSLDLSSNLLNAVPPSLRHVPRLASVNLAENLIDSVLGIPESLPRVESLNLAGNRLESLCGLERLPRLRRVDVRRNRLWSAGEVGRLATLGELREVWAVAGNPLEAELEDPRVDVLCEFAREGWPLGGGDGERGAPPLLLDGEAAGYFERQRVAERVPHRGAAASGFRRGRGRGRGRGGAATQGTPDARDGGFGTPTDGGGTDEEEHLAAADVSPGVVVAAVGGGGERGVDAKYRATDAAESSLARRPGARAVQVLATPAVKPVKHRAGATAAVPLPPPSSRSKLRARGAREERGAAPVALRRGASPSSTTPPATGEAALAAVRRNRRLVHLGDAREDEGTAAAAASAETATAAGLSDSDAIKQAAREGRVQDALGVGATKAPTTMAARVGKEVSGVGPGTASGSGVDPPDTKAVATTTASARRVEADGEPPPHVAGVSVSTQEVAAPAQASPAPSSPPASHPSPSAEPGTTSPAPTPAPRSERGASSSAGGRRPTAEKSPARQPTTTTTTTTTDLRRRIEALRGDVGDDWLRVLVRGGGGGGVGAGGGGASRGRGGRGHADGRRGDASEGEEEEEEEEADDE